MYAIQSTSVSEFRNSYDSILKRVTDGPVLVLQRSSIAAVLVSPEEWNRLQHYKRLAILEEQSKLVQAGNYLTQEELEQGLRERRLID